MSTPIALDHLTYFYGKQRGVIDVTFTVTEGEIFGFLGPNGAGKTTTIRVLMGLMRPSGGSARVFGLDSWNDSTEVKRLVGLLPGEIRLYERMTGLEFLEFFASFRGNAARKRGLELAERLELELDRRIKHLSKGNRQKLAVVQALMHDTPLLIMDEPSSGLDPLMQTQLLDIFAEERERGKTLFLSSHVLPEVERIADRVAIIREGRLVAVESVARLKEARERTMELSLAASIPDDQIDGLDGVRVISKSLDGLQITLGVRGKLGPLLERLANLPVDDLVFGPPDLESVFLHYYSKDETIDTVESAT